MTESNSDGCTEGTARLANSTIKNEGRIEVCRQGTWGPVCGVGAVEAYIACRELGFDAGMTILILPVYYQYTQFAYLLTHCVLCICTMLSAAPQQHYSNSEYGDGTRPFSYSITKCYGWEKTIPDCTVGSRLSCSRSQAAAVICRDGNACTLAEGSHS